MFTTKKLQSELHWHDHMRPATHELFKDGKHFAYVGKNKYRMYLATREVEGKLECMGYGPTLAALKTSVASGKDRMMHN